MFPFFGGGAGGGVGVLVVCSVSGEIIRSTEERNSVKREETGSIPRELRI